jgi:hypothetical protein
MNHLFDDTLKTASKTIDRAKDSAHDTTDRARSTLADGIHAATGVVDMLRHLGIADALGWVGLQRRRSPIASVMTFGAGFFAGAAAGVLFAPLSGVETRKWIAEQAASMVPEKIAEKAERGVQKVEKAVNAATDTARDVRSKVANNGHVG